MSIVYKWSIITSQQVAKHMAKNTSANSSVKKNEKRHPFRSLRVSFTFHLQHGPDRHGRVRTVMRAPWVAVPS